MMATGKHVFGHTVHTANEWLQSVAREFDTDDLPFVHRALRAWLHGLRDELSVDACAHFAAQLPQLLRGIYYEGWVPSRTPVEHDGEAYVTRFAREAHVRPAEVRQVASTVAAGLGRRLPAGQLAVTARQLPRELGTLLGLASATGGVADSRRADGHALGRVAELEEEVGALRDAVTELVQGLAPSALPDGARGGATQGAHRARQILLAVSQRPNASDGRVKTGVPTNQ